MNKASMSEFDLDRHIDLATQALLACQRADGHFLFELEADATIPAEYVLLRHYLAEPVDAALEAGIAAYLRRIQGAHDGWPLFHDGEFDMSATVKAYFALKMIGDDPQAGHMRRAREAIRSRGGAERSNVFTRSLLALYGVVPWRAVPVMPVEIMLLPKWFPFHLDKISYWSRTVIVPLLVLMAKKPRARNPKGVTIDELFLDPPQMLGPTPKAPQQKASWFWFFRAVDNVLRAAEPLFPKRTRQRAIDRAVAWVGERLNGEDGLGAIYPAMANSVMMYDALGLSGRSSAARHRAQIGRKAAGRARRRDLLPALRLADLGYRACLPRAAGSRRRATRSAQVKRGLDWLVPMQVLDVRGDWSARRPDLRPGGWAFQYANPHYPDVDDTAVVAMAMDRMQNLGRGNYQAAIDRAREWIVGMQSRNGGWGAFDADNDYYYLNNIPFADHGALLDPPTEDVSARCLSMLAQLGDTTSRAASSAAIDYLRRTQLADGCWFGRWGMNYIYGTWSVLCALNAAGIRAATRRKCARRSAGLPPSRTRTAAGARTAQATSSIIAAMSRRQSTASQTAWALLGFMAAGEVDHPAVARGINISPSTRAPTASGTRSATPRRVSRACSICATTAIRNSSRSGRWRATAI